MVAAAAAAAVVGTATTTTVKYQNTICTDVYTKRRKRIYKKKLELTSQHLHL